MEEQGKALWLAINLPNQNLSIGAWPKQLFSEHAFIQPHLIQQLFIVSQRADELGDEGNIVTRCDAQRKCHKAAFTSVSAKSLPLNSKGASTDLASA